MCEKCQDKGFIEENHGLVMILCDCDKAREVAEKHGIPWREDVLTEETLQKAIDMPSPKPLTMDDIEALSQDSYIPPEAVESMEVSKELEEALNDSNNRTESDNQPIGSTNPSKPKQSQKPKAKKKARARSS